MSVKYLLTSLLIAGSLMLSGCESEKVKLLPSPCTGLDDSPCGPKRPVNTVDSGRQHDAALAPHEQV